MKWVRHKKSWEIVPMMIIDADVNLITNYIWETSNSVGDTEKDFEIEDHDICKLDPGGMYNTKIPHVKFKINGASFDVQLSRIEDVLYCMEGGKERVPGYIRFRQWRWFVILPKLMFINLKEKLKELEKSDEAMNAELTERNIRDDLVEKGIIIEAKKKPKL